MKYVLKYTIKSKYLHFIKQYYKEFDDKFEMFCFIINNKMDDYKIYMLKKININELTKMENERKN